VIFKRGKSDFTVHINLMIVSNCFHRVLLELFTNPKSLLEVCLKEKQWIFSDAM